MNVTLIRLRQEKCCKANNRVCIYQILLVLDIPQTGPIFSGGLIRTLRAPVEQLA